MVQYSIVVALRIIRGLPGIILWPASHWAPLALKRLARYFLATSYFNKRQIFLASYFFTKIQLSFRSLWIESAPKMQRWSLKKIKHAVSNWECFHALDNCKNLFYANIVQLLAHFFKILYQLLPVWLWWGPVFVYRWKLSPVFLTETDNSQNSCFSSKQPSWVLSLNTDPPTHQAPRHHYFRGNSDRRLNIIPLKNRSVYLVICCAIRLQSNYNGAELLDNYELLPSERFRLNIAPHGRPFGDPWSIGHLSIAVGPLSNDEIE